MRNLVECQVNKNITWHMKCSCASARKTKKEKAKED